MPVYSCADWGVLVDALRPCTAFSVDVQIEVPQLLHMWIKMSDVVMVRRCEQIVPSQLDIRCHQSPHRVTATPDG